MLPICFSFFIVFPTYFCTLKLVRYTRGFLSVMLLKLLTESPIRKLSGSIFSSFNDFTFWILPKLFDYSIRSDENRNTLRNNRHSQRSWHNVNEMSTTQPNSIFYIRLLLDFGVCWSVEPSIVLCFVRFIVMNALWIYFRNQHAVQHFQNNCHNNKKKDRTLL